MNLGSKNVADSYELLLGQKITQSNAARLATLLGDREELLAHLLLREDSFSKWPGLGSKLRATARRYRVVADTPRSSFGDLLGTRRSLDAADRNIRAAIDSAIETHEVYDAAVIARITYELTATNGPIETWRPKQKTT